MATIERCRQLFQVSRIANSKSVLEVFDRCLPVLIKSCIYEDRTESEIKELRHTGLFDRFERVLDYNVSSGKKIRGLLVVEAYRSFVKPYPSSNDFMRSIVLGWCLEFLQASFLVADDIMDNSKTRRGQPCWYTIEDIGLSAFNDAFFLESTVYTLLDLYMGDHPSYSALVKLFHDGTRRTINGQEMDLMVSKPSSDCRTFNMSTYSAIVKWKTAFYTLLLPVHLGLTLSRAQLAKEVVEEMDELLMHLGIYFQVQDDYLDVFGEPSVTGKVGTDIQDNKCAWPIVRAMELATPSQREHLYANYGKPDIENVRQVKRIFYELRIQDEYAQFEENSAQRTRALITSLPKGAPKRLFINLANRLFKRAK